MSWKMRPPHFAAVLLSLYLMAGRADAGLVGLRAWRIYNVLELRANVVAVESEMEYRRRMSGDSRYIAKSSEETLDAVSNEQAQGWLRNGGRTAAPPVGAVAIMEAAIETSIAAGARNASVAVQRATALLNALREGPSSSSAPGALRPFSAASTNRMEYSEEVLPGAFDGTRQGVARAIRADRYRRQMPAAADARAAGGSSDMIRPTPAVPSNAPAEDEPPGQPQEAPSVAGQRQSDVDAEDEEQEAAGSKRKSEASSLDAKLDAIWSNGYAEPWGAGGDESTK